MIQLEDIREYYIGYYNKKILLCVSINKKDIIRYMTSIRGLSNRDITINKVYLDSNSIEELYDPYLLTEYSNIKITNRDISAINSLSHSLIERLDTIYNNIGEYLNILYGVKLLSKDIPLFEDCMQRMSDHLLYTDEFRSIIQSQILTSYVFSTDIELYLLNMGYHEENSNIYNYYKEKTNIDT